MGRLIPYFYYDLLARIIPGGLALALVHLSNLQLPLRLARMAPWLKEHPTAQAVLLPIVLGAVAYVIGLSFDAVLGRPVHRPNLWGFRSALRGYHWTRPAPKVTVVLDPTRFANWSHDIYLIRAMKALPGEPPHMIRFHAEAKMFAYSSAVILILILTKISLYFACPSSLRANDVLPWCYGGIPGVLALGWMCYRRYWRKAVQIINFIDHFNPNKTDIQLTWLQSRLEALKSATSKQVNRDVWSARRAKWRAMSKSDCIWLFLRVGVLVATSGVGYFFVIRLLCSTCR